MKGKILSTSIVLFNNDISEIKKTINYCLICDLIDVIYLIDNSDNNSLEDLVLLCSEKIKYFFQNRNLGFGKAHNIALKMSKNNGYKYHLILNPDIIFESNVINSMLHKLESDNEIGLIMPKIINPDGSNQFLPKLLPSPINLVIRVFGFLNKIFTKKNNKYILKNYENIELNVPLISGCFCIYRIESYAKIGGYDDKFFMYYEDFDLSRRVHLEYKTLYYPTVSVVHGYERGATKNYRLFKIFVSSVVKYFNKYGWFLDSDRKKINEIVIQKLNQIA